MKKLFLIGNSVNLRNVKMTIVLGFGLLAVSNAFAQPKSLHDLWKEKSGWNLHSEEQFKAFSEQYDFLLESPDSVKTTMIEENVLVGDYLSAEACLCAQCNGHLGDDIFLRIEKSAFLTKFWKRGLPAQGALLPLERPAYLVRPPFVSLSR